MTSIAWTGAQIARTLEADDVLYLADDDQQSQALTAALRGMLPDAPIFFVPSSDALPGDPAPASPANVGVRVSALHALRMVQQHSGRGRIVCVMSGEAAARLYPPPTAFDQALPRIRVGDALSMEQLSAMLDEIGYFADDRVDEPGEMAVRGEVVDIFPADAGCPARIEIAEGQVASIRPYDAVTQRSIGEIAALEIGRETEPAREGEASILNHLGNGVIVFSEKAERR